ncbi:MAG: protein kinase [Polyangiaceae bacterium]|nr:protein kinase [Polyangiaceae bacterium]
MTTTLELLASLTQYAEAGAVQRHTLQQAAEHALQAHGENAEVLVAVAKLQIVAADANEARAVVTRAIRLFPSDHRLIQLASDLKLETPSRSTVAARHDPAPAPVPASSSRRSAGLRESAPMRRNDRWEAGPESARTPLSRSSGEAASAVTRAPHVTVQEAPRTPPPDTSPPATPRSVGAQPLRPTVRMNRVSAAPERPRWGRETLDSRPDRESPISDTPRSVRFPSASGEEPRSLRAPSTRSATRDAGAAGATRASFDAAIRSGRAATGNLKLLDPTDSRRHLDRYELIGEIASGGMATVYLARLAGVAGFQRFYAIKRLHPHLADEQEFIDMFLDEARLAAGIHHPNVVPILEVGTSEAGYYLVMDYIEGDTLSGVMARATATGMLPRHVGLRIMIDALHGLHAAHELTDSSGEHVDLVHRDCSPQNILVGVDGSSRITDFGVARASSRLSTTRSATVKGKLAYLSPEQATGQPLDRRSDLFGMGVILWEVLVGRRLFRADTDGATLSRILVDPIPLASELASDVPELLARAVARALQRDMRERYSSAADMADAIEAAVRETGDPECYVGSSRDVAAFMRDAFGADISLRRDVVRNWTAQSSDTGDGPNSQQPRRVGLPSQPVRRSGIEADREAPSDAPVSASTVRPAANIEGQAPNADAPKNSNAAEAPAGPNSKSASDENSPDGAHSNEPAKTEAETTATQTESAAPAVDAAPTKAVAKRKGGPPLVLIIVTLLVVAAAVVAAITR